MTNRQWSGSSHLALAILLLLAAPSVQAPAQTAAETKQKVLVRFTWKLKGEYAPLFVALDKGYYAAEGLDVAFAEGSGAETVVKMVGVATDKIAYGPATVSAEAVEKGLSVKVVAVYQPEVPIALVSFPDVPLKTPKDLEGRTLGVSIGETFANLVQPLAKINNVDLSKVNVIQMNSSARATQFMARKIDTTSLYLSNELPLFERQAGVKLNVMKIADFGLKVLGAAYLVNADYAKSSPDTIRKLLRGTAKGYEEAKRDHKAAAIIMAKYMTLKIDPDILEQQVKATVDATPDAKGKPIGWQSDEAWKSNLNLLKDTHLIKEIKDSHVYYTNEYLR